MSYLLSESLLDEYEYAEHPLLQEKLHAWDRVSIAAMLSYASGVSSFGMQMMASQNRVAKYGRDFMLSLGYSERAAKNFRAAMMFHDIGKTHTSFDPSIWTTEGRPTPEEKEQRRKHAWLGADMFQEFAEQNAELAETSGGRKMMQQALTSHRAGRADEAIKSLQMALVYEPTNQPMSDLLAEWKNTQGGGT